MINKSRHLSYGTMGISIVHATIAQLSDSTPFRPPSPPPDAGLVVSAFLPQPHDDTHKLSSLTSEYEKTLCSNNFLWSDAHSLFISSSPRWFLVEGLYVTLSLYPDRWYASCQNVLVVGNIC
jgi:hypothetical protein